MVYAELTLQENIYNNYILTAGSFNSLNFRMTFIYIYYTKKTNNPELVSSY